MKNSVSKKACRFGIKSRLLSMLLTVLLVVSVAIPMTAGMTVESDAVIPVVKFATGAVKIVTGAVKIASFVLKMEKSGTQAAQDVQNSDHSFWELFSAYNYGNAAVYKIEDLSKEILPQLSEIRSTLSQMNENLTNVENSLRSLGQENREYIYISEFNKDYVKKYSNYNTGLLAQYENVVHYLGNGSEAEIERAFYQLYKTASELDICSYLTGEYNVFTDQKNILDIFWNYVQKDNTLSAKAKQDKAVQLSLDLYGVAEFREYCLGLCYTYQFSRYEDAKARGEKISGYTFSDISIAAGRYPDLFRALKNEGKTIQDSVLINVFDVMDWAREYLLLDAQGYYHHVYAEASGAVLHPGDVLGFHALPLEWRELFDGECSFVSSDENCARFTEAGMLKVTGNTGSFSVTLEYEGTPIYTVPCTVEQLPDGPEQFSGGYGTKEVPFRICCLGDLKTLAEKPSYWSAEYYYQLCCDLNLENETLPRIGTMDQPFLGHFDGCYHQLYNVNRLFSVTGGEIKNLILVAPKSDHLIVSSVSAYAGLLCDINKAGGSIENCLVLRGSIDVAITYYTDVSLDAGGICGLNEGSIVNCEIDSVTISANENGAQDDADYLYYDGNQYLKLGGIAGENKGKIQKCLVESCNSKAAVSQVTKHNCTPGGAHGNRNAYVYQGGIAGYSTGNVEDCFCEDFHSDTKHNQNGIHGGGLPFGWCVNTTGPWCYLRKDAHNAIVGEGKTQLCEARHEQQGCRKLTGFVIENVLPYLVGFGHDFFPVNLYVSGVDDLNNPVIINDFSVTDLFTSFLGDQTASVSYLDEKTEIQVRVLCLHEGETETRNAVEATATKKGYTGDKYCRICGELVEHGTPIAATNPSGPAIPADAASIIANNISVGANGEGVLTLNLKNNPGMVALMLRLECDSSALTILSVENGEIFSNLSMGTNCLFLNTTQTEQDGVLAKVRVRAKAESGDYPVNIVILEAVNENEQSISLAVSAPVISVGGTVLGDVTGDGVFNLFDLVRFQKVLSGQVALENAAAADVNGDGTVSLFDLVRMQKMLSGIV